MSRRAGRRGSALMVSIVMMVGLASFSIVILEVVRSFSAERRTDRDELAAKLVAEAGMAEAVFRLESAQDPVIGDNDHPMAAGSGSYWVEQTVLPDGMIALTSTGLDGAGAARVELVLEPNNNSFYEWAAFGADGLTMDSNARVDSYDSGAGTFDSQETNGGAGNTYANPNGNIGSNGDVLLKQNSVVHGDAVCGPTASTTVIGNAEVDGSTSPAAEDADMPPIDLPAIVSAGDITVTGTGTSLGPGDIAYDAFLIDGNAEMMIVGPARLVVQTMELNANAELIVDASAGPVEIYVVGDFLVNSNTLIASTTYTPADIQINLLSDNVIDPDQEVDLDEVDFDSNAQIYGTIYAPNATVEINSNFELFGSLIARKVLLDSNCQIHFDEALLDVVSGSSVAYQFVLWRELPISSNSY